MYIQYHPAPTIQHFNSWMFSLDSGTSSNEIEFISGFLSAAKYQLQFDSNGNQNSRLEFLFYENAYLIHSVTFYTKSTNQVVVELGRNFTSVRIKVVNNGSDECSFSITNLNLKAI